MAGYALKTRSNAVTFWTFVRGALDGFHQDYTAASLNRAILLLTIPMVLEMALPGLFVLLEIFWMARFGPEAVAILGLAESIGSIILAAALGLGIAVTALVARRIGAQNQEGAAIAAVQGIFLAVLLSLSVGLPCLLFPTRLMAMIGAPGSIIGLGSQYVRIYLGAGAVVVILYVNNAIFRGAGEATLAMRLLWVSILVNAVADPILMFGWGRFRGLGVLGCALGAVIGRSVAVIFQVWRLFKGTERLRILAQHCIVRPPVLGSLIRISAQAIVQLSVAQLSLIGVVRIISLFGVNAIAGYTVAFRIVIFALLPSKGASNVPAVLVGQNLGAAKPDRANKAVWLTSLYNTGLAVLIAMIVLWNSGPIVRLFVAQQPTFAIAQSGLCILILATVAHAFGLVMLQGFNGAGDAYTPMLVSIFSFLVVQLPAAWILAIPGKLKSNGAFLSVLIGELTAAVGAAILFHRGRWKRILI